MRIVISALLCLFISLSAIAKEYRSLSAFKTETGKKELNKRDWLREQRENNSIEWQEACLFNLSYEGGYKEYNTPEEREDFYKWYNTVIKARGHEVMWPQIAELVNENVNKLISQKGNVAELALAGSKIVFDSTFSRLQRLYQADEILKGEFALAWDKDILDYEQYDLVQPLYDALDEKTYKRISSIAEGKSFYGLYVPDGLEFFGYLNSYTDRIKYAEEVLMPYLKNGKKAPYKLKEKKIKQEKTPKAPKAPKAPKEAKEAKKMEEKPAAEIIMETKPKE